MALKDLLVHIDGNASSRRAAIDLAVAHGAKLIGLHVVSKVEFPGHLPIRIPEESVTRTRANDAERRIDALRDEFLAEAETAGCDATFETALDTGVQSLLNAARFVDLVVVGKDDVDRSGGLPLFDNAQLVGRCSRPVLVIPAAAPRGPLGRDVMVAWNGRPKSVRAVNDALPLLRKAKRVTIVAIDPAEGDRSTQGIREHLERHGIAAEVRRIVGKGGEAGDTLVSVASDLGADLLVMGAYSRGGVRELLLGSTTRRLMKTMTTPILMVH